MFTARIFVRVYQLRAAENPRFGETELSNCGARITPKAFVIASRESADPRDPNDVPSVQLALSARARDNARFLRAGVLSRQRAAYVIATMAGSFARDGQTARLGNAGSGK